MKKLKLAMYRFLACEDWQKFMYGVALTALFYPIETMAAVLTTAVVSFAKEKIEGNTGGNLFSKVAVTCAGGIFLISWYGFFDYLKYASGF